MRRVLALLVALSTLGPAAASGNTATVACTSDDHAAVPLVVEVGGEPATGLVALPAAAPSGIVAFAHGYGHTSRSWAEHLERTARDHGVVALAMDYRGTEFDPAEEVPSSRGWQVAEGAEDTIAATQRYEAACDVVGPVVIFGVSMGGNASGLTAAAGATRIDGTPLYDWWFNVEGATNVVETYHEARALAPVNAFAADAVADIERQMGGTFEEVPEAYLERAVVTRAADIAAAGVRGVVHVHGVDDGLVPYNQTLEMVRALDAAGVPSEVHTIIRRGEGEAGTTASGTVLGSAVPTYEPPLAGHASERSTTHAVMRTAFARLGQLLDEGIGVTCEAAVLVHGDADAVRTSGC
jgi:predicted alpha/beta-hydrolase family hydrolase